MAYEILAAGPVVRGNGTMPHRIVLVGWYEGDIVVKPERPDFTKFSTHYQSFTERDLPQVYSGQKFLRTELYWGHYFHLGNRKAALKEAYEDFGKRVQAHAENYGQDAEPTFEPGEHRWANYGPNNV